MKTLSALLMMVLCTATFAHHSRIQYDMTEIREMNGEIVAVKWRNPHVMYTMRIDGSNGEDETWMLEAGSIYMLARTGITRNRVEVGDKVRVAGYASGRGDPEFYLTNVLLPDGKEVVMLPSARPYWLADAVGGRDQWSNSPEAGVANGNKSNGIFRVWSRDEISSSTTGTDLSNLPLTEPAREKKEAFDPLRDDPALDCISPGMPRSMGGPHPIQFLDHGDAIEIQNAEFDIRRTVYLTSDATREPQDVPLSKQGYSLGIWKEDTLEVHTTRVNWPFFDGVGTPLSTEAEMLERFTVSDDQKRLDYEIVVTDPVTFSEPVVMRRYWVDLGEPMEIYNCVADSSIENRQAANAALLEIERRGFVGSVLVAKNGNIEYIGDFGFSEKPTSAPSYWIASITKQFVATGILLLHERGELDINKPVLAYLDDVPDDKADITLFQLLVHTSGLRQNYAADGITDRHEALRALLAADLQSEPGMEFSYANDNYNILAIILEVVAGQSYESFMHEQVFVPAGMRATASWGMPTSSTTFVPPVATPLGPAAMQRNWGFCGATGMRASVPDLFSFLQSLETGEFLSRESVELLKGNHVQTAGGTEIGFNWFGQHLDNGIYTQFSRGQESFGGNAVIYVYPEQELTIITATNAGPAEAGDGPVRGWSRITHEALAEIYLAD